MRHPKNYGPKRYKGKIAQILAAILSILIVFKTIAQVYIPFHSRPKELFIICIFNMVNFSVVTLFYLWREDCNRIALNFLKGIEYIVAILGLVTEVLLIFFSEIELHQYLKYVSASYLITSVVGLLVLYEFLLNSARKQWDDKEKGTGNKQ